MSFFLSVYLSVSVQYIYIKSIKYILFRSLSLQDICYFIFICLIVCLIFVQLFVCQSDYMFVHQTVHSLVLQSIYYLSFLFMRYTPLCNFVCPFVSLNLSDYLSVNLSVICLPIRLLIGLSIFLSYLNDKNILVCFGTLSLDILKLEKTLKKLYAE